MRKSPNMRGIPLSTCNVGWAFRSHESRPPEDEPRNLIPYDWFCVEIARSHHATSILADGPWWSWKTEYPVPRVAYCWTIGVIFGIGTGDAPGGRIAVVVQSTRFQCSKVHVY